MAETDALWGGQLLSVYFDPVEWTLRFDVTTLDDGDERRYQLVLEGVTQWRSSRETILPWTYADLTEVHVSEVAGQALVEMVLWSESNSVTVHCARLRLARVA